MNQIGFSAVIQLRSSNRARFTGRPRLPPITTPAIEVNAVLELDSAVA